MQRLRFDTDTPEITNMKNEYVLLPLIKLHTSLGFDINRNIWDNLC